MALPFNKLHLLIVPIHKGRSGQTEDEIHGHDQHDPFDGLAGLVNGGTSYGHKIGKADGYRQGRDPGTIASRRWT